MSQKNTLDSWIDQNRLNALMEAVRPGCTKRPSTGLDLENMPTMWETSDTPPEPMETLLAEESLSMSLARDRVSLRSALGSVAELPPRPRPPKPSPRIEPPEEPVLSRTPPPQANSDPSQIDLDFAPPAGDLDARLRAFLAWVRATARADKVFIVDAYGASLARTENCEDVFLASVSNLADALGRGQSKLSGPDQGALLLEVEEGQILSLIQAKWDASTIALGLIRPTPLPRHLAARYRTELAKLCKPRRRERD